MLYSYSNIDKPTPPRNVKVTDIRRDCCHLHWEPPLDDGGSAITRYVIEAIDLSRPESSWNIVGETFHPEDRDFPCTNLDEGHRYKFRVKAVNHLGLSQPCTLAGDGILMRDPWGKHSMCPKEREYCQQILCTYVLFWSSVPQLLSYLFET